MVNTAFIYPGQGAQYVGMGRDAAEKYGAAAHVFEEADDALGFRLSKLIFEGGEEELKATENTQPALLTVCTALTAGLAEALNGGQAQALGGVGAPARNRGLAEAFADADFGLTAAAGLSIGEYAAHVLAGTLSFYDAVRVVRLRGRFMQEAAPEGTGAMAAVLGLDAAEVERCCREAREQRSAGGLAQVVAPANFNCPGQIVIAGHKEAVETACALCRSRGAKRAVPLAVSAPFHCELMSGAAERLAEELSKLDFRPMQLPVISNATAEYVTDCREAERLLVKQAASPVQWEKSVRAMLARGVTRFVEIGPGKTLAGFVRKIDPAAEIINVSDAASIEKAASAPA